MRSFLSLARRGDYAAAASYLDLSGLPGAERGAAGERLAREFHVVLDRTLWLDLDALSDRPEGIEDDGLPAGRDRVGTIRTRSGPADLLLARVTGAEGGRVWRVSSSTVRHIPEFYAEHGYPAFVDRLPREFVAWRAFDTDLWQWIGLLALALAAWLLAFSVTWVLRRLVLLLVHRTETDLDNRVADALNHPLRLTVTLYLFLASSYWLRLAVPVQGFIVRAAHGLTVILVTWMLLRVVDILTRAAQERMLREERRGAVSMVNLGRRAAKVVIVALGILGLLQNLGFNVTGIVAGLGIGGLAVALGAQKTLENLFGGVALTVDRPIRVGDFCRFGDKTGTVEDVGLRSTRVRTPDGTVISVPNAELASIEIENFTVRDRFRLLAVLGVRYETRPDQLRRLVETIGAALAAHPKVAPDPLRVRFVGFGASSLEIEVLAFVVTQDVNEFYSVREELLLRIMDLVAEAGTSFAFPSQTLYLGRDALAERESPFAPGSAARRPQREGAAS
jgi:MscS family membrane protein